MSALETIADATYKNRTTLLPVPDSSASGMITKYTDGTTPAGFVVDKIERWGGTFGFGMVKGYYGKRALINGMIPIDLAVGGVLSALSLGIMIKSGGSPSGMSRSVALHASRIGDAGMQSFLDSMGARFGASLAKKQLGRGPAGALPGGWEEAVAGEPQVVGALPEATGGAYLTPEEIARFSDAK